MYKVEKPKNKIYRFRVDRGTEIFVEKYCKQNKLDPSKLFRSLIETLKSKI